MKSFSACTSKCVKTIPISACPASPAKLTFPFGSFVMPVSRKSIVSNGRNGDVQGRNIFGRWLCVTRPVVIGASTIFFNREPRRQGNPVQDDMKYV